MRSSPRLFLILVIAGLWMLRTTVLAAPPTIAQAATGSPATETPTPPASPRHLPLPTPPLPWLTPPPTPTVKTDTIILGGQALTLDQCLGYARQTHPLLKAAQAKYAQAIARVHQSQALYVPSLNLNITRTHTYTENGGQFPSSASNAAPIVLPGLNFPIGGGFAPDVTQILLQPTLTFSWYIVDGGKRKLSVQRDIIDLLTYVLNWRNEWRKLSLQIEQDYLAVEYNRGLLAVQQDSVQMAAETYDQAAGLFRAGRKTRLDVLQSESDLLGARGQLYQQMGALNKSWATLEADLGVPLNAFARLDPIMQSEYAVPPREAVLELAFTQRSDVLSYSNQIAVRKAQIQVNNTALRPTLQTILGFGYIGQDFPMLRTFNAQLALAFPLSAYPAVKAQDEEVLGNIKELLENTWALRLQIIGNVNRYYIAMLEAEQRREILDAQVSKAEAAYKVAFKRYKGGISEFIEVTNARSQLNNARLSRANANNDRANAIISLFSEIEMLLPRPLPPVKPTQTPSPNLPGASPYESPPAGTNAPASPGMPAPTTPAPASTGTPAPPPTPAGEEK